MTAKALLVEMKATLKWKLHSLKAKNNVQTNNNILIENRCYLLKTY